MKKEIQIELYGPGHFVVNVGDERHPDLDHIRRQFKMFYGAPDVLVRMASSLTTENGVLETIEDKNPIVWAREALREKEAERMMFAEWERIDHP
jgi:hypothetical protein